MDDMIVFGDSITYGSGDIGGGWVWHLRKLLEKRTAKSSDLENSEIVYNLGVDGENTTRLVERFEREAKSRFYEKDRYVVIFNVGGNDSCFMEHLNGNWIAPDRFRHNVRELISMAKGMKPNVSKIVFIGITPCDEKKTTPFEGDIFFFNRDRIRYEEYIRSTCEQEKVKFIGLFKPFSSKGYEKLLLDGLHPGPTGHRKIFEIVKKQLTAFKII